MREYRFTLIVPATDFGHDAILDATDAIGEAGYKDASIRGCAEGLELLLARAGRSLQQAIASAIADVERAG